MVTANYAVCARRLVLGVLLAASGVQAHAHPSGLAQGRVRVRPEGPEAEQLRTRIHELAAAHGLERHLTYGQAAPHGGGGGGIEQHAASVDTGMDVDIDLSRPEVARVRIAYDRAPTDQAPFERSIPRGTRDAGRSGTGLDEATCEAVATIVVSSLLGLLNEPAAAPEDSKAIPLADSETAVLPWPRASLALGYEFAHWSGSWVHGPRLSVGYRFGFSGRLGVRGEAWMGWERRQTVGFQITETGAAMITPVSLRLMLDFEQPISRSFGVEVAAGGILSAAPRRLTFPDPGDSVQDADLFVVQDRASFGARAHVGWLWHWQPWSVLRLAATLDTHRSLFATMTLRPGFLADIGFRW